MSAVVVFGSTGLVGTSLVKELVERPELETVYCYGRRSQELDNTKLRFVEGQYQTLKADLDNVRAKACFITLGTTIRKAGSQEAFRDVDFRMVHDAASWAKESGADTLVVVSSVGADSKSMAFYPRVKGEVEEALSRLQFLRLFILRPGLLLGSRNEFRLGEALAAPLMRCINPFMVGGAARYRAITADDVAAAMVRFALDSPALNGHHVIEGRRFSV